MIFKGIQKNHKVLVGVFAFVLLSAMCWRVADSRMYHSDMGINLVVVGENSMAIVGISKKEESLTWVDLPSNLRVDGYPVTSIWGLGEIDNNSEDRVITSLGEGLGLWLRVALKVDEDVSVDRLLNRLLSLKEIENLNWLDRYVLYKDVSGLAGKGIVLEMSLPQQVLTKVQEVDGYEWLELNEAAFVWSRDLWPKTEAVNLGIKMKVVNVSDTPGLARVRARQLESVGFRVVKVEAGDRRIDRSCLVRFRLDLADENEVLKQIAGDYLDCDVENTDNNDELLEEVVFFVND